MHERHCTRTGSPLNVLFAAVEMSPLAKVGGLGDVTGSLPRALRANGDDVRVAMPMHGAIERVALNLTHLLAGVKVPWPGGDERVDVWQADVRGVPVYLLENARYFVAPERLRLRRRQGALPVLLRRAARLRAAPGIPAGCRARAGLAFRAAAHAPGVRRTMRIRGPMRGASTRSTTSRCRATSTRAFAQTHGITPADLTPPAGLPGDDRLQRHGAGHHARRPRQHRERHLREGDPDGRVRRRPRRTAARARERRLRHRQRHRLRRVQPGDGSGDHAALQRGHASTSASRTSARYRSWRACPQADARCSSRPSRACSRRRASTSLRARSTRCSPNTTRSSSCSARATPTCTTTLAALEAKYPGKVKNWFDFNPKLGQQIYAGCDVFLMPSRYEPCGLGQLISLRYGAVPLVRRTGGLADTVQDADASLSSGTGFVFEAATADELEPRRSVRSRRSTIRRLARAAAARHAAGLVVGPRRRQVPRSVHRGHRRPRAGARSRQREASA